MATVTRTNVNMNTVDDRVSLTFAANGREKTSWIEITYPQDAVPSGMIAALAEIGFKVDTRFAEYAYPASDYDRKVYPNGYRLVEVSVNRSGSGLFGTWTAEDATLFMREARSVLRRFGFTRVPMWRKTLADRM
jgi:hypothetical protein